MYGYYWWKSFIAFFVVLLGPVELYHTQKNLTTILPECIASDNIHIKFHFTLDNFLKWPRDFFLDIHFNETSMHQNPILTTVPFGIFCFSGPQHLFDKLCYARFVTGLSFSKQAENWECAFGLIYWTKVWLTDFRHTVTMWNFSGQICMRISLLCDHYCVGFLHTRK